MNEKKFRNGAKAYIELTEAAIIEALMTTVRATAPADCKKCAGFEDCVVEMYKKNQGWLSDNVLGRATKAAGLSAESLGDALDFYRGVYGGKPNPFITLRRLDKCCDD